GAIPAGRVPLLLKDLRDLPTGWFYTAAPRDTLPLPLRLLTPLRKIEVLPDLEGIEKVPEVPAIGKVHPAVRELIADAAKAAQPVRLEVAFQQAIQPGALLVRAALSKLTPGASVEGYVGHVATIRFPVAGDADKIAQLPEVFSVRFPQEGQSTAIPSSGGPGTLGGDRIAALHAKGYRGAGTRAVILATDVGGIPSLLGSALPKTTTVVDLTAELNPTLEPTRGKADAAGAAAALAFYQAAPEAQMTIIRIDPSAFHQVLTVARAVAGQAATSEAIRTRTIELEAEAAVLGRRRDNVFGEYRKAFENLSDEEGPTERRTKAAAAVQNVLTEEKQFRSLQARLANLRTTLEQIAKADVVINTMAWDVGQPAEGLNELNALVEQYFTRVPPRTGLQTNAPVRVPTWVQASSAAGDAVWSGALLDRDGNGVMEFAAAEKLPAGTWTEELNFLKAIGADGKSTAEIATQTQLHITLQWREPRISETQFTPLPQYTPQLQLLRQLDPTGAKVASDELVVTAQSKGSPVTVHWAEATATYEQTLSVTVPVAGRYALRLVTPLNDSLLVPAQKRSIEVHPRVTLQTKAGSRVVFDTFPAGATNVGVPGDTLGALTVGTQAQGKPVAGSLMAKPDVSMQASVKVGDANVGGP
ncbi:MAG: hypothetical protein ACRCZF_20955, partial [Gemmataceae bacterium]